MAAAVGTPCVALFGPMPANATAPMAQATPSYNECACQAAAAADARPALNPCWPSASKTWPVPATRFLGGASKQRNSIRSVTRKSAPSLVIAYATFCGAS